MISDANVPLPERSGHRIWKRQSESSVTKFGLQLMFGTLAGLCLLSVSCQVYSRVSPQSSGKHGPIGRHLVYQGYDDDDDDGNAQESYEGYSCMDLYANTGYDDVQAQCRFAKECNDREGLAFGFVFCSEYNSVMYTLLLSPIIIVGLITLFRMLGSTAEDFFSPALEMLSVKMGLPPRFAGVSLLALGNGAADVSATMNAITSDPHTGYLLSLGALTGAGMFISTVVAGLVIVTANGVPCRGALVRDVIMLTLTVSVVYYEFSTGVIGEGSVSIFFGLYGMFVFVVLVADIYHRTIMIPRLELRKRNQEIQRQRLEEQRAKSVTSQQALLMAKEDSERASLGRNPVTIETQSDKLLELKPIANSNAGFTRTELHFGRSNKTEAIGPQQEAIELAPATSATEISRFGRIMEALSNYNTGELPNDPENVGCGWGVDVEDDGIVVFHGRHTLKRMHHQDAGSPTKNHPNLTIFEEQCGATTEYQPMMEEADELYTPFNPCVEGSGLSGVAKNWSAAFIANKNEFLQHWLDYYVSIYYDEDNSTLDKFVLTCEMPFTILRQITVPVPCEGYYCRPMVALSLSLSPVWFGIYYYLNFDTNLFVPYIAISTTITTILGIVVMRYAPSGVCGLDGTTPNMSLPFAVPLALYGFAIAATWIDWIANRLVAVLGFLGVIFHIPGTIMGMTVLAWGNSIADLAADITMAKKGLANMAITACFAGPIFNILVGLGFGFTSMFHLTNQRSVEILEFPPNVKAGVAFLVLNCCAVLIFGLVLNKGRVPMEYGYCGLGLYAAYLITAMTLYFL